MCSIPDSIIRVATAADAERIFDMQKKYIDCPWTYEQIVGEINDRDALFYVASCGGDTVAFLSGVCAADECEISDIAVEVEYRRRKIGSRLFSALFAAAAARGVRSVFLLVRSDNVPAIGLYESLGFKKVGRRSGYYAGADADIMRCKL